MIPRCNILTLLLTIYASSMCHNPTVQYFLWCLNQCIQHETIYSKPLQSLNLSVPTFDPQGVNTLSPSACIMLYLYITHFLEECTSPRGNAYVEGLTSDPKQRQGFFVMGDKPSASHAELFNPCRQKDTFTTKGCTNA